MNLGYTVPARLYPLLLTALPAGLAVVAWFPDRFVGYGFLSGVLAAAGFSFLLSQLGRDEGRKKQQALWDAWGGAPATQLLRHRNNDLDEYTRNRYHKKLCKVIPDIDMPDEDQEKADAAAADVVYGACTSYLLRQTRDTEKFNLLFKENVNYGFRRNLWGMRSAGIVIATCGLIAAAIPAATSFASDVRIVAILATILNAFLLVCWLLRINSDWVRVIAFAYAQELIGACEQLPDPPSDPNKATIHLP